ncbi:putative oxidoreductase [Aspergillus aurantiobrunneus]
MATVLTTSIPWHDGEDRMHQLLRVPSQDNPTMPFLSPGAGLLMKRRPWCSLWVGEEGLARPTSASSFEIGTPGGKTYDPIVESLLLDSTEISGKPVSFLAVDLENRRRVKVFGKMTAGSLNIADENESICAGIAHLTVHVDGSLGNCPKYLNAKHMIPAPPDPKLISEAPQLRPDAIDFLNRADCLFIASSHGIQDMDTNIRGGPPGFVRVVSNEPGGAVLVYPEYSGNRPYQTLGNLQTTHLAGYVFPDFETGNALFVTGRTEILIGKDASSILARSNIVVRVTVAVARFVGQALSFRGISGKPSPYNPSVRYLTTEKISAAAPGNRQYATFLFYDELDMGYSHMMDDDPLSLNDDYIRTFTISSCPGLGLPEGQFEITIRKHSNVPLKGSGGEFQLTERRGDILPFIVGGIGITPVLAQLPVIDISRLRLFWSISIKDIALALDTFKRFPALPSSTTMFVTGLDSQSEENSPELEMAASFGAQIKRRRVEVQDLNPSLADVWYFCGSPALKVPVLNWLAGKKVVYEDFNY